MCLHLCDLAVALCGLDEGGDFSAAVDNCGVVSTAQKMADLLERQLGILAEEVHHYVSCFRDGSGTARALEGRGRDVEVAGYAADYGVG